MISTPVKIVIINKAAKDCVDNGKAKGSIDVLRRETTGITYAPKLKNLQGSIIGARLEGKDADKFEGTLEKGKLVIRAKAGAVLSTKSTYSVTPVYEVLEKEGERTYEVNGASVKVKVTQGKVKGSVSSDSKVIYRTGKNTAKLYITLTDSGEAIAIENAELTNYTEDLTLSWTEEAGCFELKTLTPGKKITTSGKAVDIPIRITYRDSASDKKKVTTTVTYKLTIK